MESHGEVVGYVCGNGAEILKAANALHDFRDVYRFAYPDAVFIRREPRLGGIAEAYLVIGDTE